MSGGGDSVKKQKRLLAQLTAMLVMLGTMAALSRQVASAAAPAPAPHGAARPTCCKLERSQRAVRGHHP